MQDTSTQSPVNFDFHLAYGFTLALVIWWSMAKTIDYIEVMRRLG